MPLEFIYLNAPEKGNGKAMGKEKWHRARLEKSTKHDNIEFRKRKMSK